MKKLKLLTTRYIFLSFFAALIFLLALPAFWPFVHGGLPETVDGTHHLMRLMLFDAHIQKGSFYPRWTHELVLGHGYPVFNFYGPAIYYLGVLLHRMGLDLFNAQMEIVTTSRR